MKNLKYILVSISFLFFLQSAIGQTSKTSSQEHLVLATIWYQHSPEMKALYYQGFNIAKMRLAGFAKQKTQKPKAVVVDIDETMMDNSPFEAQQILESHGFTSETWKAWSNKAKAKATPGAVEFTHFCDSLGVTVVYISNRKLDEIESTLKNLDSLKFAFAKKENLLFKSDVSGKKVRRDKVSEKYEIVMLIGDNLNDFSEVFENRDENWGSNIVEKFKNEFGNHYIMLPNPMYGEWEKNIYGKNVKLTDDQMRELRIKLLEGFR